MTAPRRAVPEEVLVVFRHAPQRALLLGHVHPDADVVGTLLALGLALRERGWTVLCGGPHPVPEILSFLPGVEDYRVLRGIEGVWDVAVLTDCPNPARTEGLLEAAQRVGARVVNIDHHHDNRRYGHVNWVEPVAAATAELVYQLLVALGARVSAAVATNLYTALHVDTGSFRYSNVTPETFRVAATLVEAGADPAWVASRLYERRSPESLRLLATALGRVQVSGDGQVAWLTLPAGTAPEAFVEAEDLVTYPRSIASVKVACLLRERDGVVKVSLRGKGDVDVSRIAAKFGGGGHPNAAGCSVVGSLDEVTREVLAAVQAALEGL